MNVIDLRSRRMRYDDEAAASPPPSRTPENERWAGYLLPAKAIRRAGFAPGRMLPLYWFCKLVPAVLLPAALYLAEAGLRPSECLLAGLLASFAVDAGVLLRMQSRQRRIAGAIGYFIDMTIAFLRSGMPLDAAIGRAFEYGLPPRNPLRQELRIVLREIRAGRPRDEAFFALHARTGVAELHSLATAFQVGFDLGTPIAAVLERQSALLRDREREGWRKRIAAKAAVSLVPIVFLNFPIVLVIVFYPPALEIANLFVTF